MRRDRRPAVTLLGQPDRIRALAGAEMDQVGILAVAERDVWQLPPGRDVGKLLPLRIVNVEAGAASPRTAMYRLPDITVIAVAAVIGQPVNQHPTVTDRTIRREVVRGRGRVKTP